jgi:hypothetical protein
MTRREQDDRLCKRKELEGISSQMSQLQSAVELLTKNVAKLSQPRQRSNEDLAADSPDDGPISVPKCATASETFTTTLPTGAKPGDKLKATTPSGVKVLLRVPEDVGPGTELTFTLPEGATVSKAASDDTAAEAEENVEAEAIIKMQSAFRGHHVRFQQTEEARLQWLQFHLQTGEYEEARALCVSDKETQIVAAAEQGRWERGLELLDEMGAA